MTIFKNPPPPPKRSARKKWPFGKMKVGDMVMFAPPWDIDQAQVYCHGFRRDKGWKFTSEKDGKMIRICRIA